MTGSAHRVQDLYLTICMKPLSMCSCWWQCISESPGLSATKSTAAVCSGMTLMTSFISPLVGLSPILVTSKLWRCRCMGLMVGHASPLMAQGANFEPCSAPASRKVSVKVSCG